MITYSYINFPARKSFVVLATRINGDKVTTRPVAEFKTEEAARKSAENRCPRPNIGIKIPDWWKG